MNKSRRYRVIPGMALLAVAAIPAASLAQPMRCDLRIVDISPPSASGDIALCQAGADRSRLFQVEYRMVDLDPGDAIDSTGLGAMALSVLAQVSGSMAGSTTIHSGSGAGLLAPFNAGGPPGAGMVQGLSIVGVLPITFSSPGHAEDTWSAFFRFRFTAGASALGVITFTATAVVDPGNGERFRFYDPPNIVPVGSTTATDGPFTIQVGSPYTCCLPDHSCAATTSQVCAAAGGQLVGVGVPCLPTTCCPLPVIFQQPQAQSPLLGTSIVLQCLATSGSSVQWRAGGVPLVDGPRIQGATNRTMTIGPVIANDLAAIDAVVTLGCASITSVPVLLNPQKCPGDFNASRATSTQDLFDFLAAFFTPCP